MRALINCSVLYCHPEKWNKKITHDSDRALVLTLCPLFLFPLDLALELYLSVISGFFFYFDFKQQCWVSFGNVFPNKQTATFALSLS